MEERDEDDRGEVRLKEKGNDRFKEGKYPEAVQWYTLALMQAPSNAILFGNRSTSFHQLNFYKLAILDAHTCTITDPTWFKGYLLKGKSLQSLQMV